MKRLALVVPHVSIGGGVSSVAEFICAAMERSPGWALDVISLATSARDDASLRISRPSTWRRGVHMSEGVWNGRPFRHVGSVAAELEFARYCPRADLTRMLNDYDLVQVVSGSPAWGLVCRDVARPVCLQVATLAKVERERRLQTEAVPRKWWLSAMTKVTSQLDMKALDHVDRVLVENQWMYEVVSDRIGADRVVLAFPGVDTRVYHPIGDAAPSTTPYMLSVARFADHRKNVPLLFEGYAAFRNAVDDAPRLVLAGKSGPTDADWNLAERLGVRQHIEFIRGLEVHQLATQYREAEFFVLASDEEGFGMVILEAMASGIPVISTRSGGPEGIISDGVDGLLVPVKDPVALSAAMSRLHESGAVRKAMGLAARTTVEARFSLEVAGKVYIDTYKELLSAERAK